MARSTCDPNAEAPKGMMKFEVIRSTIRDSLGQYCSPGDYAVLTKDLAKGYLSRNFIRVALPDFGDEDEGNPADADGTDEAERAEVEDNPRPRSRKRRTRSTSDSEGGGLSGGASQAEASEAS